MTRRIIAPLACLSLLLTALAAQSAEQRVYQWTDSHGVVHYSQFEPEKTKSEARDLHSSEPAAPATTAAPAAPKKPSTFNQANCDIAKANQQALAAGRAGQLTTDKDGDGKPDAMTEEDIEAAKDLAERQIKTFCED